MAGIELKTEREVGLMREAGRIVAECHTLAREMLKPGVTTGELDEAIAAHIIKRGGKPTFLGQYGFPKNVCISVNEEVVHGIPGPRVLRDGDVVGIDIGCTRRGFIGDSAWTHPVGKVSEAAQRLLRVGEETLWAGLRQIRDGGDLRDVSRAIQETAEAAGYSVVRDYTGHGVGRTLHEAPQIPNYVERRQKPLRLQTGMTMAVEPMVNQGTGKVRQLKDQWTVVTKDGRLSVHFEHTVAVMAEGARVLTAPSGESRRLLDEAG